MERSHKRIAVIFSVLCFGFVLICLNLANIVATPLYTKSAQNQSGYSLDFSMPRGFIYDRSGKPLVNQVQQNIGIVSPWIDDAPSVLPYVADSQLEFAKANLTKMTPFAVTLKEPVVADSITCIKTLERYTYPQIASHVVGYLDYEGSGQSGIEKSFDEILSNKNEQIQVGFVADAKGKTLKLSTPTVNYGEYNRNNVTLTLDRDIQRICEDIGGELIDKGCIIVMEISSGEVLAMCSFPSFSQKSLAVAVNDTEGTPLINRCLYPYNVGSTFKIITADSAIRSGVPISHTYNCTGSIEVGDQIFKCHNKQGHGEIDMTEAMIYSCNPYFISLALSLQKDTLTDTASAYGFGKSTQLAPEIFSKTGNLPIEIETLGQLSNLSFGQGELTATPLQITQMICAVCNDGKYHTPSLIKSVTAEGVTSEYNKKTQIIATDKDTADVIKQMLVQAASDNPDSLAKCDNVSVGGKTATAQTGRFDQNGVEKNIGWFAGFFPADNPKYAVCVMCEDAISGNKDCAPVFSRIASEITSIGK